MVYYRFYQYGRTFHGWNIADLHRYFLPEASEAERCKGMRIIESIIETNGWRPNQPVYAFSEEYGIAYVMVVTISQADNSIHRSREVHVYGTQDKCQPATPIQRGTARVADINSAGTARVADINSAGTTCFQFHCPPINPHQIEQNSDHDIQIFDLEKYWNDKLEPVPQQGSRLSGHEIFMSVMTTNGWNLSDTPLIEAWSANWLLRYNPHTRDITTIHGNPYMIYEFPVRIWDLTVGEFDNIPAKERIIEQLTGGIRIAFQRGYALYMTHYKTTHAEYHATNMIINGVLHVGNNNHTFYNETHRVKELNDHYGDAFWKSDIEELHQYLPQYLALLKNPDAGITPDTKLVQALVYLTTYKKDLIQRPKPVYIQQTLDATVVFFPVPKIEERETTPVQVNTTPQKGQKTAKSTDKTAIVIPTLESISAVSQTPVPDIAGNISGNIPDKNNAPGGETISYTPYPAFAPTINQDWNVKYGTPVYSLLFTPEDEQVNMVRYNGFLVQHIRNPCEAAQLEAVLYNPYTIQYIHSPVSELVQMTAVNKDGLVIQYIKNPSRDVQMAAVKQNVRAFVHCYKVAHSDVIGWVLKEMPFYGIYVKPNINTLSQNPPVKVEQKKTQSVRKGYSIWSLTVGEYHAMDDISDINDDIKAGISETLDRGYALYMTEYKTTPPQLHATNMIINGVLYMTNKDSVQLNDQSRIDELNLQFGDGFWKDVVSELHTHLPQYITLLKHPDTDITPAMGLVDALVHIAYMTSYRPHLLQWCPPSPSMTTKSEIPTTTKPVNKQMSKQVNKHRNKQVNKSVKNKTWADTIEDLHDWGFTPLMRAVMREDVTGVRAILGASGTTDASLNAQDTRGIGDVYGMTALHWAVRTHNMDILKLLLADPRINRNLRDNYGRTALHWAARWYQADMVDALLAAGALADIRDNNGKTAMEWMVEDDVIKPKLMTKQKELILSRLGQNPTLDTNPILDTPIVVYTTPYYNACEKMILTEVPVHANRKLIGYFRASKPIDQEFIKKEISYRMDRFDGIKCDVYIDEGDISSKGISYQITLDVIHYLDAPYQIVQQSILNLLRRYFKKATVEWV